MEMIVKPGFSRKILGVGVADSQLKWLRCVIEPFVTAGYEADYVATERKDIAVTPEVLAAAGIEKEPMRMTTGEVADSDLCFEYAFVLVIDNGSNLLHFFHRLDKACRRNPHRPRPIVITGFIGMVLEKFTEGILWRTGADYILLNSERDERLYESTLRELSYPTGSLFKVGLPLLSTIEEPARPVSKPPKRVVFAAQPHFPEALEERMYIVHALADYANRYPERDVIVKLRVPPGHGSFHREKHHYEQSFQRSGRRRPRNLLFEYGSMAEQLAQADLLLTVSSTAALEAAAIGIPFVIINDFGVKESIGTAAFTGSGALASLEEITEDRMPQVSREWLEENGIFEPVRQNLDKVRVAGERRLSEQSRSGKQLPLPKPYYIHHSSGAYYRRQFRI